MKLPEIDKRSGYSTVHVAKAILLIGENPVGREKLISMLGLNEASVRTLLTRLESSGYVNPTVRGHMLAGKGKKVFSYLKKNIIGPKKIYAEKIALSRYNVAYLVKKRANKIRFGVEQRDQAIVLGADGLTTLVYMNGLVMPAIRWRVSSRLNGLFEFSNGDILLIGSAKNERLADLAALNSAVRLLE